MRIGVQRGKRHRPGAVGAITLGMLSVSAAVVSGGYSGYDASDGKQAWMVAGAVVGFVACLTSMAIFRATRGWAAAVPGGALSGAATAGVLAFGALSSDSDGTDALIGRIVMGGLLSVVCAALPAAVWTLRAAAGQGKD
jgi:hypothetical protein